MGSEAVGVAIILANVPVSIEEVSVMKLTVEFDGGSFCITVRVCKAPEDNI